MPPSHLPTSKWLSILLSYMSRIPRFTAQPPAPNSTGVGQFHIELAELLHDQAFGDSWWRTGRTTLFPVGSGGVSVQPTGAIIPNLVPTVGVAPPPNIPPAIDRRDIPPTAPVVPPPPPTPTGEPVLMSPEWIIQPDGRYKRLEGGVLSAGSWSARAVELMGGLPLQQPVNDSGGSMDLGDVFSDIYSGVDAAVGGVLPGGVPFGTVPVTGGVPGVVSYLNQPSTPAPAPTSTQMPVAASTCSHGPSPVYKKVCGEYRWVTPKRRRKKRLATQSDLKDLAALSGVLGKGKLLEVWIATHS